MFLHLALAISFFSMGPLTVIQQEGGSGILSYDHPTIPNSLAISSLIHPAYSQYNREDFRDSYHLIRKTVSLYQQQNFDSWVTIGNPKADHFEYLMVPLKKGYESLINLFLSKIYPLVDMNLADPNPDFVKERTDHYLALLETTPPLKKPPIPKSNDAFSNQYVIDSQLIYEGEKIYLLLNYCPLTSQDSFLVIPKRAAESSIDLTEEEFIEAELISQMVVGFYPEKTAYFLDKNGKNAFQHEPRFHKHIFFTNKVFDWPLFLGRVIYNSPLSKDELTKRVSHFRSTLGVYLNEHS